MLFRSADIFNSVYKKTTKMETHGFLLTMTTGYLAHGPSKPDYPSELTYPAARLRSLKCNYSSNKARHGHRSWSYGTLGILWSFAV